MTSRMKLTLSPRVWLLLLAAFPAASIAASAQELAVTPEKPSAIYAIGEKIVWRVEAPNATSANYVLKKGGATLISTGAVTFKDGKASIETSLKEPGTILAEVTAFAGAGKPIKSLAGAAVAPDQLQPSISCPKDFDDFWSISALGSSVAATLAGMSSGDIEGLKSRVQSRLPADTAGHVTFGARANAIKGRRIG